LALYIIPLLHEKFTAPTNARSLFVTNGDQADAGGERQAAQHRRKRYRFFLFRSCYKGTDFDNFFLGGLGNSIIRQPHDSQQDQNDADNEGWFHKLNPRVI
jgi:hypothetical protein